MDTIDRVASIFISENFARLGGGKTLRTGGFSTDGNTDTPVYPFEGALEVGLWWLDTLNGPSTTALDDESMTGRKFHYAFIGQLKGTVRSDKKREKDHHVQLLVPEYWS